MSSILKKPKIPSIGKVAKIEDISKISEYGTEAMKQRKRRLLQEQGYGSTLLGGLANLLKKRLGD